MGYFSPKPFSYIPLSIWPLCVIIINMKIDIKSSIIVCLLLGTLFYFLSYKNKTTQIQQSSAEKPSILIIDKKPLPLPAPKPLYCVAPDQNRLGVGDSWKSKK
jgi:hypothetical protein